MRFNLKTSLKIRRNKVNVKLWYNIIAEFAKSFNFMIKCHLHLHLTDYNQSVLSDYDEVI